MSRVIRVPSPEGDGRATPPRGRGLLGDEEVDGGVGERGEDLGLCLGPALEAVAGDVADVDDVAARRGALAHAEARRDRPAAFSTPRWSAGRLPRCMC